MLSVIAWSIQRCGIRTLRCVFVALRNSHPLLIHEKNDLRVTSSLHAFGGNIMSSIMLMLLRVATSEIMKPMTCFHHCNTVCAHVYYLFACCNFYYRFILLCSTTSITRILPFLRRTSAPIQLTIVLGVLGTQEISCIWLQGCLRETIFILHLRQIDKP